MGRRALIVVAVLVVVAAAAAAWLVAGRSGGADGPSAAAVEWAEAQLDGDDQAARSLQCRDQVGPSLSPVRLTVSRLDGFTADDERSLGKGRWKVTLRTEPDDTTTLDVTVVRKGDAYVVCD